jgi:hypothetical protein
MSIASGTVLVGGTTSSTGGTSTGFIVKGDTFNEAKVVLDDSSAFIDATNISFSVKDPVVNSSAPNGYTQRRSNVSVLVPLALDNGNYTTNSVKISISCDPETTDAEVDALIELGAQLLRDADFDAFWKQQSLG